MNEHVIGLFRCLYKFPILLLQSTGRTIAVMVDSPTYFQPGIPPKASARSFTGSHASHDPHRTFSHNAPSEQWHILPQKSLKMILHEGGTAILMAEIPSDD